jgi:hypothetical protein
VLLVARVCKGLRNNELCCLRRKGRGLDRLFPHPRLSCLLMSSNLCVLLGLGSGTGCLSSSGRISLLRVATCLRDQLSGRLCFMLQLSHLQLMLMHLEYISVLCSVMRNQSVWLLMRLVGCVREMGGGLLAVPRGYSLKE